MLEQIAKAFNLAGFAPGRRRFYRLERVVGSVIGNSERIAPFFIDPIMPFDVVG